MLTPAPDHDAPAPPAELARFSIVDAHVHIFPPRLFEAVWRWFDRYGWPIRYKLHARETLRFLFEHGVQHCVGLHYAHVPGLAACLNRFAADLAAEEPRLIACASVLPGEPGARAILDEALGPLGLRGVKIHCHVQCVAPDDACLDDVYAAAAAHDVPVIIHAGNAPASPHYACDVASLCTPAAIDRALARHPGATVIVPHLGAAHIAETAALLDRHERLHLDSTMTLNRYLARGTTFHVPVAESEDALTDAALAVVERHPNRVLYGTDFPNIPYEWDRELRVLAARRFDERTLRLVLGDNARRLFRIRA